MANVTKLQTESDTDRADVVAMIDDVKKTVDENTDIVAAAVVLLDRGGGTHTFVSGYSDNLRLRGAVEILRDTAKEAQDDD